MALYGKFCKQFSSSDVTWPVNSNESDSRVNCYWLKYYNDDADYGYDEADSDVSNYPTIHSDVEQVSNGDMTRPSSAVVERLFSVSARTNRDVQKKPAIRQQLGKGQ